MSIEKHPTRSGWYYVKSWPNGRNGKVHRDPVEGYDRALALDNSIKKRNSAERNATAATIVTHPKMADIWEEYIEYCRTSKKSPVTIATRERRLGNYLMPALGHLRVKQLTQQALDRYAATVGFWTYDTDLRMLLAMIGWMRKRGYCDALHFKPEHPKGKHAIKPIPHPADLVAAIEALPVENQRILFLTMVFTGLRWNEARNLRWEDVDIKEMTIRVKEVENAEQDIVYIPAPLQTWYRTNRMASGIVFEGRRKGMPYSYLWKSLAAISAHCGVHVTKHTFRHASGTYLYESTSDIYQVQAHLRHARVTTSQIYARMSVSRRKSAVEAIVEYTSTERLRSQSHDTL